MGEVFWNILAALVIALASVVVDGLLTAKITSWQELLSLLTGNTAVMASALALVLYAACYAQYRRKRAEGCKRIMFGHISRIQDGEKTVRITLLKLWRIGRCQVALTLYASRGYMKGEDHRFVPLLWRRHKGLAWKALSRRRMHLLPGLPDVPPPDRIALAKDKEEFTDQEQAAIDEYMRMADLKDFRAFRSMSFRPRRVYSSLVQKEDEVPWGVVLCEEEASAGPFSDARVDMYDSMCLALSAVLV